MIHTLADEGTATDEQSDERAAEGLKAEDSRPSEQPTVHDGPKKSS
jgi:hypothetical protein